MEINGLPLHALAIHAAVVLGPVAALTGVVYAVPRFRDRARIPLVVVAALALVSIWVAYLSGQSLLDNNEFFRSGPVHDLVKTHQHRAGILRWSVTGFAAASFLAAWLHTRPGRAGSAAAGLVAGLAVLTAVYTVLTGDAGARIAWSGIKG